MRLVLLLTLAATALATLIDSARRAGPVDHDDPDVGASPSATLELLERARSRLDEHAPRILIELGIIALLAAGGAALLEDGMLEVVAVLGAVGLGIAMPGVRWLVELRQERRALDARIAALRSRLESGSLTLRASSRSGVSRPLRS